jgi:HSF-type DNA-binding
MMQTLEAMEAPDRSSALLTVATALAELAATVKPMSTTPPTVQSEVPSTVIFSSAASTTSTDRSVGSPLRQPSSLRLKVAFPEQLMAILNDQSHSDVITWLPKGKAFAIVQPDMFRERVLPKFISTPIRSRLVVPKYQSFLRKLHRWYVSAIA